MNWERFRNLTRPLDYWDTLSLKFVQRLIIGTWDERLDWNCTPRPWVWDRHTELKAMYDDVQAIIDAHGSTQTLDEWIKANA